MSKRREKVPHDSLTVVNSKGARYRFLRGIITHDLMQRGVEFDDAYSIASEVRDQFVADGRAQATTVELREQVELLLIDRIGSGEVTESIMPPEAPMWVIYHGEKQPFSRGLLARSIQAAGLGLERAYGLVAEIQAGVRADGVDELPSEELARRVEELLRNRKSRSSARRYRLLRRVQRLAKPVVVFIGGASGTGKSSLSLELGPTLRIYRINSTDTIRQVMRMMFSPAMMPALHASSFEVVDMIGGALPEEVVGSAADFDFNPRLLASYEEQAARVMVGVRAVVERAISEQMSIVVEGVHLHPPMVPFPDLEGAIYQVPLMLATLDEEVHRTRFLSRARHGGRRAERYIENFEAIREVHDHLVNLADAHDVPIVDTSSGDLTVLGALRIVTSVLEKKLPPAEDSSEDRSDRGATLLLIVDGMPDRAARALGGRTPLQAAATPTFDRLAREGQVGLADPVAPGVVADTAAGTLAILGQSPLSMKRGPVEALGAGLELRTGDIALRGNLATINDEGRLVDRRAGRIRDDVAELAKALNGISLPGTQGRELEILVQAATEHRLAIVLRGDGLSSAIRGSDPGETVAGAKPLAPQPEDPADERAVYTAGALALFEQAARKVLRAHPVNRRRGEEGLPAANAILSRGAGRVHRLVPLEEAGLPLRISCVGGDRTILGLAEWLGAKILRTEEMTANLDTDLEQKFTLARARLDQDDLVVIHVKGADIAGHDRRPDLKAQFLERLDRALGDLVAEYGAPLRIAVASDHATLSESGQHSADPAPVLLWGTGVEADLVEKFDEVSASSGQLGRFPMQLLLSRLFDLS